MSTVFYSWQSDLPGSTNRNFIEDALDKALRALLKDPNVYQPPREVDKDTLGVAGSPHIAETIFDKIDSASACVFDVSIVLRGPERVFPNPNVLVELGYALKVHPSARVIMVLNMQTGKPEELPFDLRFRRVLQYDPVEIGGDRSGAKADLVKDLVAAFKATFAHNDANRFSKDEVEFSIVLYNNVRHFLNLHAELADRSLRSESEMLRMDCGNTADNLRELAAVDAAAERPEVVEQLTKFCESLDKIKAWMPALGAGHYQQFVGLMDAAEKDALPLLEAATPPVRQSLAGEDVAARKRQVSRRAVADFARFKDAVAQRESSQFRSIRESLEGVGREILGLAADLEVLGDEDARVLRPAGHALHVASIERSQEVGYREVEALVARLGPLLEPLARFAKSALK